MNNLNGNNFNEIKDHIDQRKRRDLGLYIHVPFCKKKCDYCDFLSGPANKEIQKRYFEGLMKEIVSYKGGNNDYQVPTIFIGGGTPSAVDANYIKEILETVRNVFSIKNEPEVSIEVNPGTVNEEKLNIYKSAGINRISFGLQSTNNRELKLLGRIHTYEEFVDNYHLARNLGFHNINIDLMSALPGQTLASWELSLHKVLALNPEHISAYSLIIEEGTPFYKRYGNNHEYKKSDKIINEEELPDEEEDRKMYMRTKQILQEHGYQRYEISNYAKEGYECIHNNSYWTGTEYLGLGLGASSLVQNVRFHNITELNQYIKTCNKFYTNEENARFKHDRNVFTSILKDSVGIRENLQVLSIKDRMEEFMFLGLRRDKGISKNYFFECFNVSIHTIFGEVIDHLIKNTLLISEGDKLKLSEYGVDISNQVLSQFLLD
ncbi:radical SAM family heme chaperone HemW [Mobilitalea sibirica]|uniref:Heme chaperone HemW n=1 Tax=Mobilitalea sibirica TaxID=1462919 RepID=A0A8J7KX73_9FIRM|nr:radical SAM family heme chaperone HemW [Mobilitalea sibirica]MBH1941427.1 radical SAM family heme chaperone HemW [Mobilitalea sibirica]